MLNSIFHPRWAYHHRYTVGTASLGRIIIDRPGPPAAYDFDNGGPGVQTFLPIYEGRARVQKLARPNNREFVEDRVEFQQFRVQFNFEHNEIPYPPDFEWRVNDRVRIVADPADPDMVGETLYLRGWMGSTNSWHRTLICQTNMKQD